MRPEQHETAKFVLPSRVIEYVKHVFQLQPWSDTKKRYEMEDAYRVCEMTQHTILNMKNDTCLSDWYSTHLTFIPGLTLRESLHVLYLSAFLYSAFRYLLKHYQITSIESIRNLFNDDALIKKMHLDFQDAIQTSPIENARLACSYDKTNSDTSSLVCNTETNDVKKKNNNDAITSITGTHHHEVSSHASMMMETQQQNQHNDVSFMNTLCPDQSISFHMIQAIEQLLIRVLLFHKEIDDRFAVECKEQKPGSESDNKEDDCKSNVLPAMKCLKVPMDEFYMAACILLEAVLVIECDRLRYQQYLLMQRMSEYQRMSSFHTNTSCLHQDMQHLKKQIYTMEQLARHYTTQITFNYMRVHTQTILKCFKM